MSTRSKIPASEARVQRMRKRARTEACLERLEAYALGELDGDDTLTKGELDALKFLVGRGLPAYEEPRTRAAEKIAPPAHTFIIAWQNGQSLPSGARFIDATPVVEALPAPESDDA